MNTIAPWYRETVSCNPASPSRDAGALAAEFARWKAVSLEAVYHHPELGALEADPCSRESLSAWGPLRSRELIVVYASGPDRALCRKAAALAAALFEGRRPAVPPALYETAVQCRPNPPRGDAAGGKGPGKRGQAPLLSGISPLCAVPVTNELFHNGNVEAWKRVIASYEARYPRLKVCVYYEGERITNLNALFQWGKVKHGHVIQFAVAGSRIQALSRLRRFLAEAASPRFNAFLQGLAGSQLDIF